MRKNFQILRQNKTRRSEKARFLEKSLMVFIKEKIIRR